MSNKAEQSKQQVFDVCEELFSKGQKPSVRLVLSLCDEIKSTSTVHKYFALWQDQLKANQAALFDKLGFSDSFQHMFMNEISRFSAEAEARHKQSAEDAIEQRNAAIDDLNRIEDKYLKQEALVDSLQSDKRTLIKSSETTLLTHEAEIDKLESSNAARESELRQQILNLQEKLTSSNTNSENLRTELAKAKLKQESSTELVEQIKEQHEQIVSDKDELAAQLNLSNIKHARSESDLAASKEREQKHLETIADQKNTIVSFEVERKTAQALNNELIKANANLESAENQIKLIFAEKNDKDKAMAKVLTDHNMDQLELKEVRIELREAKSELSKAVSNNRIYQEQITNLTESNRQMMSRTDEK